MSYDYGQLYTDVNSRLHNKLGRVASQRDTLNRGVRKAVSVPLKTLRRRYSETIRVLDGVYDYLCPADIQGHKVIDLKPIVEERSQRYEWRNVDPTTFDRLKRFGTPILAIGQNGTAKTLKATISGNDSKVTVSEMDSLTQGGTWSAIGTASDLEVDTTTYIYGTGSVKFNLGSGTQDGIGLALDTAVDIDDYRPDGSAYVSVSLPSTGGVTGITVRLGSDSSNYLEISATADIAGNELISGFNMFRLKLSDGTETGTPDYENIDYAAILIDKDTTTLTGVRADRLFVGSGGQHELSYYSRYGWRSAAGTWKENSTLDTDLLNAETEEYDLIVEYCVLEAALASREYKDAEMAKINIGDKYKGMFRTYRIANSDCSLIRTSDEWFKSSTGMYGRTQF